MARGCFAESCRDRSFLALPPPRPGSSPGRGFTLCRCEASVQRGRALDPTAAPHGSHDLRDDGLVGLAGPFGSLDGPLDGGVSELVDVLRLLTRALGHAPSIAGWAAASSCLVEIEMTPLPKRGPAPRRCLLTKTASGGIPRPQSSEPAVREDVDDDKGVPARCARIDLFSCRAVAALRKRVCHRAYSQACGSTIRLAYFSRRLTAIRCELSKPRASAKPCYAVIHSVPCDGEAPSCFNKRTPRPRVSGVPREVAGDGNFSVL